MIIPSGMDGIFAWSRHTAPVLGRAGSRNTTMPSWLKPGAVIAAGALRSHTVVLDRISTSSYVKFTSPDERRSVTAA